MSVSLYMDLMSSVLKKNVLLWKLREHVLGSVVVLTKITNSSIVATREIERKRT